MRRADLERRIRETAVTGTPEQMRLAFETLAVSDARLPPQELIGDVPVRRFGVGGTPGIVWLHGGGYVFGSSQSHAGCAQFLADRTGRDVIVPDYRLAPEHPWPAPLEDALGIVDAIGPCDLVGDSAGGHLVLNCARRRPGAVRKVALVSANTDRSGQSRTRHRNADSDLMNDDKTDAALARLSFGGLSGNDPDVSPLLADLSMLPPTFVTASVDEILLDDSRLLIRALGLAGVPTRAILVPGQFHMWTLWPGVLHQARTTLSDIAAFLNTS